VSAPWWTGLTPAEVAVECSDTRHTICWRDGELTVPAHEDPDGERSLAALGGEGSSCIEILDAWLRHRADLDVLLLASRGGSDRLPSDGNGMGPYRRRPMPRAYGVAPPNPGARPGVMRKAGWTAYAPLNARGPAVPGRVGEPTDALTTLLQLPGPLPDRLVATVIATWAQHIAEHDRQVDAVMAKLHAALYGRALAATSGWLGSEVTVEVQLADEPAVSRGEDGTARFELPFGWLADVWARGFTTLVGRSCLTAEPIGADDWMFTTIGADLGPSQTVTVRTA
jgi:hypothetical protein